MAEGKTSFVLYSDMLHTIEALEDQEAGKLFKHILRYVNDLNPEAPDKITKIAFEPIKQQLKRDLAKWEETAPQRSEKAKKAGIASGLARELKRTQANLMELNELGSSNRTQANSDELNELGATKRTVNVDVDVLVDVDVKKEKKENINTDNIISVEKTEIEKKLFSSCMKIYSDFIFELNGVPIKVSGADGKGLKQIIKYLLSASKDKNEDGVLASWKMILSRYSQWSSFHKGQIKLSQINSNIPNILNEIKNGHSKKPNELSSDEISRGVIEIMRNRKTNSSSGEVQVSGGE